MKSQIIKGIGGFYYVKVENEIVEVKARGALRKDGKLKVGDYVEVDLESKSIENVYERANEFDRPPISNIDLLILTFAITNPEPNYNVIDKVLILAEKNNVDCLILCNKVDLVDENKVNEIKGIYKDTYPTLFISTKEETGLDVLRDKIKGKTVAFSGPSGVGKSSIISILLNQDIKVGSISEKTLRGKHTTRHVEILEGNGYKIFDTPGFTFLELEDFNEKELKEYYPEFKEYICDCKYDNCMHLNEPVCGVKTAVREGLIPKARYLSYKHIYDEIKEKRKY